MNWRAKNNSDEIIISGENYTTLCNQIKNYKLAGDWTIEYFDSNQMWIEMDSINVEADTGELHIIRASHIEHY